MSKFIDITGKKFNHLLVFERLENAPGGVPVWKCLCDCGNYTTVRGKNLKNGSVKSCGCLQKIPKNITHNMSKTRMYHIWSMMRRRCNDPKNHAYINYGGRGITVCDEWNGSFEPFMDWALSHGYDDNLTIDRIDNDGNYCPDNCRWVKPEEQAQNRRRNWKIEHQGKTKNLKQWCDELNLDYKRTHNRLNQLGMTFEKAISMPVMAQKRNKEAKRKYG